MAVSKTTTVSGNYSAGDITEMVVEAWEDSEEFEPHKFRGVIKYRAKGKLKAVKGEGDDVEVPITAAEMTKALVDSGIAAKLVAAGNGKLPK